MGRQGFDLGHCPWSGLVLLFAIVQTVLMNLTPWGGVWGRGPLGQISGGRPVIEDSEGVSAERSRVTEVERRRPEARVTEL